MGTKVLLIDHVVLNKICQDMNDQIFSFMIPFFTYTSCTEKACD